MTAITFDILARDFASSVNKKIGDSFESLETRVTRSAHRMAAAVGVGFGAEKIVQFAGASVSAFEKTEAGQKRLEDAFTRFPKLADTNVASLKKLDDAIERRTGFLTRDIEAGQANLAQFNLTGTQLKQITPLLVDYADKTGQAIPEAATLLGRALLGNQRALKSIGIALPAVTASQKELAKAEHDAEATSTSLANARDHLSVMETELSAKRKVTAADEIRYRDAQDAVRTAYEKNQTALANLRAEQDKTAASGSYFDQVVAGLTGKVKGFASLDTPELQLRELRAEFDKVEVAAGRSLLPKLLELGHFLTGTFIPDAEATGRWLQHNSDVIVPLAKVVGGLTLAVYATNKATRLWESASRAATTWMSLLGGASAGTATKVAAEGAAATDAATANDALAASAESATGKIAVEGATAVTAAARIGNLLALAGRLGALALPAAIAYPVLTNMHDAGPQGSGLALNSAEALAAKFSYTNGRYFVGGTPVTDPRAIAILNSYRLAANGRYNDKLTQSLAKQYPGLFSDPFGPGQDITAVANAQSKLLSQLLAGIRQPTVNNATGSSDLPGKLRTAAAQHAARLSKNLAKEVTDPLAGLPQFAVGSGTGIAAGIAKGIKQREQEALSAAKSLASKLQGQIGSINSTLSSFKDTVAGTITGNAGLLNSGNQSIAGLINFEKHQLSIDQTFHRNLTLMAKLGYSTAFISELAQAGPQQAGNITAQLVTADVSQRNQLNRYSREIATTARATANDAARGVFPKMYTELTKQTAELQAVKKEIAQITTDLETLARTGHLQTRVKR